MATAQVSESFVARSSIRATVRAEIKQYADDTLAEAIGMAIGRLMRERDAKIAALEAAMREFTFKGQWSEGREYKKGNFVTLGAIWHANCDTNARPGTDQTWSLAIPKPKDGRDGRDAAPPEPEPEPPRTVQSGRRNGLSQPVTLRSNK
jgi:hypothetical protein